MLYYSKSAYPGTSLVPVVQVAKKNPGMRWWYWYEYEYPNCGSSVLS